MQDVRPRYAMLGTVLSCKLLSWSTLMHSALTCCTFTRQHYFNSGATTMTVIKCLLVPNLLRRCVPSNG